MPSRHPEPFEVERSCLEELTELPIAPVQPEPESSLRPIEITRRELHREVWNLAWPSVTTMMLQTVNSLMDAFFVGHLPHSKEALAATGVGGQIVFLLISLAMGVSVGTTALVARFTGAKKPEDAAHATGQSLSLSLILGLVMGAVFAVGRGTLVNWLLDSRNNPEAAHLCMLFLSAALMASVPLFVLNVLMAAFRGIGDTRTPMLIQLAMIGTHITCNILLIYGLCGFPKLGVQGAGTALALSVYVGTVCYLWALVKWTSLRSALHREHLRLKLEWAQRILKIGIPAAVQAVIRTLAMMSFTGLLAKTLDGAAGVAALQIGMRAEALAFMPGFGYSVAASTLVGQNLGARDANRAERAGWAATGQGLLVMALMASLFFIFARPLAAAFTGDVGVQRLGVEYLRILAISEPFLALGMVLTGALQGAGETVAPTYITIFTMWILRLPLAWWLMFPLNMQARGAWIAMAVSTIVGGLMTVGLYRTGRWKRHRV